MTRFLGALLLAPILALPASAGTGSEQDTVKLKSGRVLTGIVLVDDANREGFSVQRWDTGGTVFIRWSQITETERARLSNRVAEVKVQGVMLDGVRAMTAGRDVVGVLVKEDAGGLHIKTKDAKVAVQVPKSALLRPHEPVRISESEAYSPDEMVDLRLAKANEKDYASMKELGAFAASVKLYERAKEYYQKAASAADPKSKEEMDEILARNEGLIKEGKAAALLAQVKELVETIEFQKAVETAKKLLSEFGDTQVAKENKDLADQIGKKAKDYESKRAEYLAENVPQAYKDRRSTFFGQYASTKYKIAEVITQAGKIDEQVVAELAKRMKATPEEINAAWGKRELKPKTVSYGDGSWIVKGGQDGGLDTDAKTQPNNNTKGGNTGGNNGGFGFGGNRTGGNTKGGAPQNNQPQPLGKKMETKDEWWTTASTSDRRNFVEAEYAKNSGAVKKEIKNKKCSVCNGEGIRKETRQGVPCDCKCLRCHGAKDDDIIVYQ
jgi:tetratricopeptide (TPR) repeat protein